ncbi:DUF2336 domain-containing protein [Bradyrhizobium sp. ma5]|uniref:DUF2336 domain-containing protein n=1 Tax=Bradyrhizobium sp. ma5 TaxID=3344828 RepID=UPI0035D50C7E
MDDSPALLHELEDSISQGTPDSRERALWHATDLLIAGRYSDDQIWLFGAIIERLASEIEIKARAQLADRLARVESAPVNVVNKLASDKSIAVAGQILRHSNRLDVRALVTSASTQSQDHLLAISKRATLCEAVTDVLVTRGNREVVHSVAANSGALFSESGFLALLKRSEGDYILAETLGQRTDIPRHVFQQLIAKASGEVKQKLGSERPELADQIKTSVTDVTGSIHATFGPASAQYFAAKKAVSSLHRQGNLSETQICAYAQQQKRDEAAIALSLLCSMPVNVAERAIHDQTGEMVLILASALDFSWDTAMALLFLGAPEGRIAASRLDDLKIAFSRLKPETSRTVLQLYQSRRQAATQTGVTPRLR